MHRSVDTPVPVMDSNDAARLKQLEALTFFNSLAFGVVVPVLYYMIALPHAGWIAILFIVEITGRFVGRPICDLACRKLRNGPALATLQLLNVVSYFLLATVGYLRPSQTIGFALIYVSRALGSVASAPLPSVRLTTPDQRGTDGSLWAIHGFLFGCVLTILLGNRQPIPDSILQTGGLLIPGMAAAMLSLLAAAVASQVPGENAPMESPVADPVQVPMLQAAIAMAVMLACESAFSMILCVLPLTTKEILAFTPGRLALFFVCLSGVSSYATRFISRRNTSPAIVQSAAMLVSAVGLAGCSTALWLSWRYPDQIQIAYRTMFIAGLVAAAGHGLLRFSLPWAKVQATEMFPARWRMLAINGSLAAASILSVLFVSRIWELHERASLAAGGVVLLVALPLGIGLAFQSSRRTTLSA